MVQVLPALRCLHGRREGCVEAQKAGQDTGAKRERDRVAKVKTAKEKSKETQRSKNSAASGVP